MASEFKFPDVGEGVTEGKLIEWLVSEGDEVAEDQSLAEVETDKAVVEVPATRSGTILELRAEAGETINVGDVILVIGDEGEETGGSDEAAEEAAEEEEQAEEEAETAEEEEQQAEEGKGETADEEEAEEAADKEPEEVSMGEAGGDVKAMPAVRKFARDEGVDLSKVEPTGKNGRVTKADVKRYLGEGQTEQPSEEKEAGEKEEAEESGRVLATPSTRKFARENDVDIANVKGTGPAGRVTKDDVERFMEEGPSEETEEAAQKEVEREKVERTEGELGVRRRSMDDFDFEQYGEVEREEISSVRKAITKRMVEGKYTAPHVTTTQDVIISELWEIRQEQKEHAEEKGVHLTLLPFIVKAVIGALKEYEDMNASFDEEKGEIIKKKFYNIGIAVATDHGLMVPVIKDADDKSVIELAREMKELSDRARDKKLSLDEVRGGTFTITNWGAIGGEYGTPIVNFPEVGILGVGRMKDKPVAVDGEVKVEKVLPISLSFDHRVVDGAYASRFLMELTKHLEDPDLILIDD